MFKSKPKTSALATLAASSQVKQKEPKVPVPVVAASDELKGLILKYIDLMEKEKKAKADKDNIGESLRLLAQIRYAEEVMAHKAAIPSSIRMVADGKHSLLFTRTETYNSLTEDDLKAIRAAGLFDKYTRTQISLNFDKAPVKLQEKVAALLMENLTEVERDQMISTKTVVRAEAFESLANLAKDAGQILSYLELLKPSQQLRKG